MTVTDHELTDVLALARQVAAGAEDLAPGDLADAVVLVQDHIATLRKIEADLAAALGAKTGPTTANISDGRQFTLKRSPDRKAWEHDEWRRDVRREVTRRVTERFANLDDTDVLVDRETSEVTTLGRVIQQALTDLQKVHGSSPPLSTGLRALGLYSTDYCHSAPGGWRLQTVRPNEPTPETGATP